MAIICVIAGLWFLASVLFVGALCTAARKTLPVEHLEHPQSLMFDEAA